MYAFARRPAWIVSHLLVVVAVVVMVALGFWQRARFVEETTKADQIEARSTTQPVPIDQVVPPGSTVASVPADAEYARVGVTGTWDPSAEVVIRNRSYNGAPGAWVLTPLVQADGTAVAVVRGWVPNVDPDPPGPPFPGAEPPAGPVEIAGVVQLSQSRGGLGAVDPADGRLEVLNRVDLERLAAQLPYPLLPAWVLLDAQTPAQTTPLPSRVSVETPSAGQNFSYMIQWWIFAAIFAGGYVLVLRRQARSQATGGATPADEDPADRPAHDPADSASASVGTGGPSGG